MLKPIFNFVSIEKWTLKPKWDSQEYVFSEEGTLGNQELYMGCRMGISGKRNLQISLPLHKERQLS